MKLIYWLLIGTIACLCEKNVYAQSIQIDNVTLSSGFTCSLTTEGTGNDVTKRSYILTISHPNENNKSHIQMNISQLMQLWKNLTYLPDKLKEEFSPLDALDPSPIVLTKADLIITDGRSHQQASLTAYRRDEKQFIISPEYSNYVIMPIYTSDIPILMNLLGYKTIKDAVARIEPMPTQTQEPTITKAEIATEIDKVEELALYFTKYFCYTEYKRIIELANDIENGKLHHIEMTRPDGLYFSGWVDENGTPQGIGFCKKNNSRYAGIFLDGNSKFYGQYEIGENFYRGMMEDGYMASGLGYVQLPSEGKYIGWFKQGKLNGIIGAYFPNGQYDISKSGLYKNNEFQYGIKECAQKNYDTNKADKLDPAMRIVSNLDLGEGRIYSGNWADGKPSGFGFYNFTQTNTCHVGSRNHTHFYNDWYDTGQKITQTNFYDGRKVGDPIYKQEIYREYRTINEFEEHKINGSFEYALRPDCNYAKVKSSNSGYGFYFLHNFPKLLDDATYSKHSVDIFPFNDKGQGIGYRVKIEDGTQLNIWELDLLSQKTNKHILLVNGGYCYIKQGMDIVEYMPDGRIIMATMVDDKSNKGVGVIYNPDSSIYVGDLDCSNETCMDGIGYQMFPDGELIRQGIWSNGQFVREEDVQMGLNVKINKAEIIKRNNSISRKEYKLSQTFTF